MWEYVSILDPTPINIIIHFLFTAGVFCIGSICGLNCIDKCKTYHWVGSGIIAVFWFTFLIWLLVGKSFSWSEPIGRWMVGQ